MTFQTGLAGAASAFSSGHPSDIRDAPMSQLLSQLNVEMSATLIESLNDAGVQINAEWAANPLANVSILDVLQGLEDGVAVAGTRIHSAANRAGGLPGGRSRLPTEIHEGIARCAQEVEIIGAYVDEVGSNVVNGELTPEEAEKIAKALGAAAGYEQRANGLAEQAEKIADALEQNDLPAEPEALRSSTPSDAQTAFRIADSNAAASPIGDAAAGSTGAAGLEARQFIQRLEPEVSGPLVASLNINQAGSS